MNVILQLKNVTKTYNDKKVVENASLTLEKGKIYGFVGPNGAGKTTIMKMITNLVKMDEGEIVIFGKSLKIDEFEYFKRIGTLIEAPSFYENLTTKKNLELYCSYRGYYNYEDIEDTLNLLGLKKYENIKAKDLSLGNKQRLGIAQAIVTKPELVILDEPINGLDPIAIKEVRELFIKLKKEYGITMLISSHILSEVEQVADELCFINNGQILEEISMEELKDKCGEFIEIVVEDVKKASIVLENKYKLKNYKIINGNTLRVYSPELKGSSLVRTLLEEEVEVLSFNKKVESLEEYYVKKVGGSKNA